MNKFLVTTCFAIVLTGCASNKSIYYWGEYENLLYKSFHEAGEATPNIQISQLEEDIEKAKAKGKKVPPGVYAHLGLMYAAAGNQSLAMEALEMEKTLFPESVTLINGMIERSIKSAKGVK